MRAIIAPLMDKETERWGWLVSRSGSGRPRGHERGEAAAPLVLAAADNGPVLTAATVATIGEIIGATIVQAYETDLGRQSVVVLRGESFELALVSYEPSAPYAVTGDAEVQYHARARLEATGSTRFFTEGLRGVSKIEADPTDLTYVRFVQEDDRHRASLVVDRRGNCSTRCDLKLTPRRGGT